MPFIVFHLRDLRHDLFGRDRLREGSTPLGCKGCTVGVSRGAKGLKVPLLLMGYYNSFLAAGVEDTCKEWLKHEEDLDVLSRSAQQQALMDSL